MRALRSSWYILTVIGMALQNTGAQECLSLAGRWEFSMCASNSPVGLATLQDLKYDDTIRLPGTTETNLKGAKNPAREVERLTRVRHFDGQAWYRREINIPVAWQDKNVKLFLERTKYTQVWLDGKPLGSQVLYCVPQIYDLGSVVPGQHVITVLVDNRPARRPVKCWDTHQYSDNTQTCWNGILGRIELQATDRVWLQDVQVYPDIASNSARVCLRIGNLTGQPVSGNVTLGFASWNHKGASHVPPAVEKPFAADTTNSVVDMICSLGENARRWDEFSPSLYKLTVSLNAKEGKDRRVVDFGLREFKQRDSQFSINGRTTFLRGKHDACVFPLTGHPPMDVEGWLNYLRVCKEYGINHIRCHTWTPPEAALAAADRLGIYFQCELPFWGEFKQESYEGLMPEAERILSDYGNHASFVMLTLGNELLGERALLERMVNALRALDPRRLYACGSNNHYADPRLSLADDFWSTMYTRVPGNRDKMAVRGSFYDGDGAGAIQKDAPATRRDYRASLAGIPVPVIGHEIAQYSVYPDFREIPKYKGVVQARNFEIFRERLSAAGMLDQAGDFVKASGILSALCYREEIEMALRTPGFGGFQLLDLQDFPGQGTATVGILNAFMESKGLISPVAWRQFCSPVVPLARFDKFTWTTTETFSADIEVAHYGEKDFSNAVLVWRLNDGKGHVVAEGKLKADLLKQGGLRSVGSVSFSLAGITAPAKATLELKLNGTSAANTYSIWVYPAQVMDNLPDGVTLARSFNGETLKVLSAGGRVLLMPEAGKTAASAGGGFAPDFWCWKFRNKPGTLGLLAQPEHPALAQFPTAFHSDWQWYHLAKNSQPLDLEGTPQTYRPVVQVIDNISRNHKLGLIFEAKVLNGRLLVCATDLMAMKERPEARQLLKSLEDYVGSDQFKPSQELSADLLLRLLCVPPPLITTNTTTASVKSLE